MTNILKNGLAWLHAQRAAHATVDVEFTRGGAITSRPGLATLARFGGDTLLESEVEIKSNARDFICDPALFEDGPGDTFEPPRAGDRFVIVETGEVCEVSSEGADSVWRWSDPHRTAVRVHTHTVVR